MVSLVINGRFLLAGKWWNLGTFKGNVIVESNVCCCRLRVPRVPRVDHKAVLFQTISKGFKNRFSKGFQARVDHQVFQAGVDLRVYQGRFTKAVDIQGITKGSKEDNNELRKPTYASVTTKKSDDLNRDLDFVPTIVIEDGHDFVIFDEELVQNGSLRWNLTVCGHFVGMKMLYNELKYNLMRVWGSNNEVYSSNMCQFGKGRIGYARDLVEMDSKKQFKDCKGIQYRGNDGTILRTKKIRLEYSWKPPVCEFCKVFGHSTLMRDKRPRTDAAEKAQNRSEKEMVKMDNGGFVETMNRKRQAPQSYGIKKQQQPINGKGQYMRNNNGNRNNVEKNKFEFRPKKVSNEKQHMRSMETSNAKSPTPSPKIL
ncbi:DUF4283 domain-containing protein [Artemisia annua]|uniref:DUF4283 domain-containing protein n=1 Tax=Artemisia annua TaxID=35608 RepID=A0A2U1MMK9_ARTAN|nr:DUF4283 domain-containing protein [Artemisia annua]